jgi:hypothetical protein
LALGEKFGDTSPVVRGKEVRQRLLCQPVKPPPLGVDVDDPPPATGGSPCKKATYSMHSTGGCAGCHSQMDPIGFGLENYDAQGRFRSVEAAHPECSIDGEGELVGIGKFKGPAQLGALVSEHGISACLSQQLYRFATGRAQFDAQADATWEAVISQWTQKGDYRFDDLLVRYVGSEAFGFRQNEL